MEVIGGVTIRWEKNGQPLRSQHGITVTQNKIKKSSELLFKDLEPSHFGGYVCLAKNDVGTASDVFILSKEGNTFLIQYYLLNCCVLDGYSFSSPIFITIISGSFICFILLFVIL